MHMVALLNLPPLSSVSELGVQLPTDDALWEAPDAETWFAIDNDDHN